MLKSLPLRILLCTLSIFLMSSIPVMADECPDLIEADCAGGTAWFGLRHDGANVAQGHTVTLPCDAEVLSIEFMFQVTGNPNGGVPSMVAGDEIHVALIDAEGNNLVTATSAVPADVFDGWIEFTYPEEQTCCGLPNSTPIRSARSCPIGPWALINTPAAPGRTISSTTCTC